MEALGEVRKGGGDQLEFRVQWFYLAKGSRSDGCDYKIQVTKGTGVTFVSSFLCLGSPILKLEESLVTRAFLQP